MRSCWDSVSGTVPSGLRSWTCPRAARLPLPTIGEFDAGARLRGNVISARPRSPMRYSSGALGKAEIGNRLKARKYQRRSRLASRIGQNEAGNQFLGQVVANRVRACSNFAYELCATVYERNDVFEIATRSVIAVPTALERFELRGYEGRCRSQTDLSTGW